MQNNISSNGSASPIEGETVGIVVAGQRLAVPAGLTLAAALLMHNIRVFRHTHKRQAPRSFFCGMGFCFDCLVTVDGLPDQRACMQQVHDGMRIDIPSPSDDPA